MHWIKSLFNSDIDSGGGRGGGGKIGRVRPARFLAVTTFVFMTLTGCEDFGRRCQGVGLCESPEPQPVLVDVLFDDSVDSPLNRESAAALIQNTLRSLASIPDSTTRFWKLGSSVSNTTMFASVQVPRVAQGGARARRARADRFVETNTTDLMHRLEPLLEGQRSRRSPLMEGITRIAITPAPRNLPRTTVILSDTREYSSLGGDWECSHIPSARALAPRLRRANVLAHASLTGMRVVFSNVALTPIAGRPDCPAVSLARQGLIESTWRDLLQNAGAIEVRFERGVAELTNNPPAPLPRVAHRQETP